MSNIKAIKNEIKLKNISNIEKSIKIYINYKDIELYDLSVVYELILYLRWTNDFNITKKNQYLRYLTTGFMERASYIDFRYSDVFTIHFDYVYNNGKKDIATIKAALSSCTCKEHLKYHYFLYEGLLRYFNNEKDHRDYLSIAGKIFTTYAREKKYGNHNLRGLQYIMSDDDIRYYAKRSLKNMEIKFNLNFKEGDKFIHVIALDSKYYDRFSKYFFIKKSENSISKHIHIINPTSKQIDDLNNNSINYSYEYERFLDKKPYYISSRFLIMNNIMDKYKNTEYFLITDADSILAEKETLELLSEFENSNIHSLAIQCNNKFYPWSKHGAGMIIVKNNDVSLRFFDLFNKCFFALFDTSRNETMNTQWWIDQGIIYSLVEYYNINLFNISNAEKYIFFPKGDKDTELKFFLESKGKE